jgi:hypothetical protein
MDTKKMFKNFKNASDDLTSIAKKYGTDKADGHFYTSHYETHFGKFRNKKINLLEIGVGGYDKPDEGTGISLVLIFMTNIYLKKIG